MKIKNPKDSPNTDGIDPESCKNVSIIGVKFSVGDDCIAIKSGKGEIGRETQIGDFETSVASIRPINIAQHGAGRANNESKSHRNWMGIEIGKQRRTRVQHPALKAR